VQRFQRLAGEFPVRPNSESVSRKQRIRSRNNSESSELEQGDREFPEIRMRGNSRQSSKDSAREARHVILREARHVILVDEIGFTAP
jgi:hypothetical protein